jgi:hypothetical protein
MKMKMKMKMKINMNMKEQNTFIDKDVCTEVYLMLWRY